MNQPPLGEVDKKMAVFCMKKQLASAFGLLALVLVLMTGLLCCGGCAGSKNYMPDVSHIKGKLSNSELVAATGGSTVALVFHDEERETSKMSGTGAFCTGVWVSQDMILTADHCAKAMLEEEQAKIDKRNEGLKEEPKTLQEALQRLFGGGLQEPEPNAKEEGLKIHYVLENEVSNVGEEPTAWHLSKVVAFDEKHDLALLKAQGKAIPKHKVAKLASSTPELGEHVRVVGHVTGLYWTYMDGNVAAYRDSMPGREGGPWLQLSAPVFFGNSGGGAFNEYGELVGIADWIKRAPSVAFFIHLETVRSFLTDNSVIESK